MPDLDAFTIGSVAIGSFRWLRNVGYWPLADVALRIPLPEADSRHDTLLVIAPCVRRCEKFGT